MNKAHRNVDIAYRILVLGAPPVRVAEDEGLSLPRVNQIVTAYCLKALNVPVAKLGGIRKLREFVQKNCLNGSELVPWSAHTSI